ncbi:NlpC/P60 family protein [Micromonospora sp. MED01]|uniref:C40 family peptidase n=1 Tax=Micromonospora alfalfae TaxID=2911212 RepID=UPI001EE86ACC|nr:C40 family peptidase [Micromonospora alfalfae]MCG5466609.1 NlpC/P60 family protein [Micromonospora alfalfae]
MGPFAAQIVAKETEVATLGEQLLTLQQEQTRTEIATQEIERQLQITRAALVKAQQNLGPAAVEAMKRGAELPPGEVGSHLQDLGALLRLRKGQQRAGDSQGSARALLRAQAAEQQVIAARTAALTAARAARTTYVTAEATFKKREAELLDLKRRNTGKIEMLERQRDAAERQLRPNTSDGESVAGMVANPRALAAVRFARTQLGKPYEWGAEGPNRYDCSGLIWAAYRSRGADYDQLPRVSRDQYNATRGRTVDRSMLLPGDLVFFASGSSWTTIHHMGMYIGDGKMVQAPTTGDVVKISSVWWSRFYAATRVIPAVPAPTPSPSAPPPAATPRPTASPRPTPTPTQPSPTPTVLEPTPTAPSPTRSLTPSPSTSSSTPTPTSTPTPSASTTGP